MLSRLLRILLLAAGAVASTACMAKGDEKDATIHGTMLGTYQVQGSLKDNNCGAQAFGSTDKWDFTVKLSRDGNKLYWYNGEESIEGDVGSDGQSFSFSYTVTGKMSDPVKNKAGCTMTRTDSLVGTLSGSGTDISGFRGTMTYEFGQTSDSDCTAAAVAEGATALPCGMHYSLVATRQ
jgi:hypothetical protein